MQNNVYLFIAYHHLIPQLRTIKNNEAGENDRLTASLTLFITSNYRRRSSGIGWKIPIAVVNPILFKPFSPEWITPTYFLFLKHTHTHKIIETNPINHA